MKTATTYRCSAIACLLIALVASFGHATPTQFVEDGWLTAYAADELTFVKDHQPDSWRDFLDWLRYNHAPDQPTPVTPTDATTVGTAPLLRASEFTDQDDNTQAGSQWQVAEDPGFTTVVWGSGTKGPALNWVRIPVGALAEGQACYWRVRYRDNSGDAGTEWSLWSNEGTGAAWSFTTQADEDSQDGDNDGIDDAIEAVLGSNANNPDSQPSKPPATGGVRVADAAENRDTAPRQLLVDDAPYRIRAVGYQPTPIGQRPGDEGFGPYTQDIYERDLPLLRAMRCNTIRTWGKVNNDDGFLDACWDDGNEPIRVIAAFWIDPATDFGDATARRTIIDDFKAYVQAYKDHPAILMWLPGGELNYYLRDDPTQLRNWFTLLNGLGWAAFEVEGTTYHPVTTDFAADVWNGAEYAQDLVTTQLGVADFFTDDAHLTGIDIWGINSYRGQTFQSVASGRGDVRGDLFADFAGKSGKPMWLAEFGIDAWDHVNGVEDQVTQADWEVALWEEIAANSPVCVGGSVMAWSDEWWKNGQSGDKWSHDPGPWERGDQPDGWTDEEYYGLVNVNAVRRRDSSSPDSVIPRQAYYAMGHAWGANWEPTCEWAANPVEGEWYSGHVRLEANADDPYDATTVRAVYFEYSLDSADGVDGTWHTCGPGDSEPPYGLLWPSAPADALDEDVWLRVCAADEAGAASPWAYRQIRIDNSTQGVVFDPHPGGTGVPIESNLTLTFGSVVTKPGGDELTNSDLPGVLRLTHGNIDIAFASTIEYEPGGRAVITVTPDGPLDGVSTYVLALVGDVVDAEGNPIPKSSATFTTAPGPPLELAFAQEPGGGPAGEPWAERARVAVCDAQGNTVDASSAPITVALANDVGTLHGTATTDAVRGLASFGDLWIDLVGEYTLVATSPGLVATESAPFSVGPGVLDRFTVQGVTDPVRARTDISPTVVAYDALGNVKTDYTGTVCFSSSDPEAELPLPYAFYPADGGVHTFGFRVVFHTPGEHWLRVADGAATGTQTDITVANGPPETPSPVSPANGGYAAVRAQLTATDFNHPDGPAHAATQWQVAADAEFTNMVWDSGEGAAATAVTVPEGLLAPGRSYAWRVRYKGDSDDAAVEWSDWSDAVGAAWAFITTYPLPFTDDFSTDTGWMGVTESGWGHGPATAGGGLFGNPDPPGDHSGTGDNMLLGFAIGGDYPESMSVEEVVSPAIDCSGQDVVQLSFWRWLGVDDNEWARAGVHVSNDATTWIRVWENGTTAIADPDWVQVTCDITPVAANQPTVFLKFTMGPMYDAFPYCGWNIDDVTVRAGSSDLAQVTIDADETEVSVGDVFNVRVYVHENSPEANGVLGGPLCVEFDPAVMEFAGRFDPQHLIRSPYGAIKTSGSLESGLVRDLGGATIENGHGDGVPIQYAVLPFRATAAGVCTFQAVAGSSGLALTSPVGQLNTWRADYGDPVEVTINPTVPRPLATVSLEGPDGSVAIGDTFQVRVLLREQSTEAHGILGGPLDIDFDAAKASYAGAFDPTSVIAAPFDDVGITSGTLHYGRVNELGGLTLSSGYGDGDDILFAVLQFEANAVGTATFSAAPGESGLALTSPVGQIQPSETDYGTPLAVEILATPRARLSPSTLGAVSRESVEFTVGGYRITHYRYSVEDGEYGDVLDVGAPIVLTGLTEGGHAISVLGKNADGVWQEEEAATTLTWLVDLTAPTEPVLSHASPPPDAPTSSNRVEFDWAPSGDALSGVAGYVWEIDQAPDTALGTATTGEVPPSVVDLGDNGDGQYWLHLCAVDSAGNASEAVHCGPWLLDTTPPAADPGGPYHLSAAADLAGSGSSDGGSGILDYQWEIVSDPGFPGSLSGDDRPVAAFDATGNGTYVVRLTVTDAAGLSHTESTDVVFERVAPVLSSVRIEGGAEEVNRRLVTVELYVSAGTGAAIECRIGEQPGVGDWRQVDLPEAGLIEVDYLLSEGDGQKTVYATVRDRDYPYADYTSAEFSGAIDLDANSWLFSMQVTGANTEQLQIGMQQTATDSFDDAVDAEASMPGLGEGTAYFYHDQTAYWTDIRARSDEAAWTLVVVPGSADLTLAWTDQTFPVGKTANLTEVDGAGQETGGVSRSLGNAGELTVPKGGAHYYDIRYGVAQTADTAPTVDLNGDGEGVDWTATFEEDGGPVLITDASGLDVRDQDDADLESAVVTIANALDGVAENLSIEVGDSELAADYDPASGVLSVAGTAPVWRYEAALRTVRYDNVSQAPNTAERVVTFVVSDGDTDGPAATARVAVLPVNDAPAIAEGDLAEASMDEDGAPTAFALTLNADDADGDTLTWRIKTQAGNGVASVVTTRGAQQIDYAPTANWNGRDSFVVQVDDGLTGTDEITVNVTVDPRNDPPVNTAIPAVAGFHHVGQDLIASDGTWNDDTDLVPGEIDFSYQWQVADTAGATPSDIAGQESFFFVPTIDENLKFVRVVVTATDDGEGLPATQRASAASAWLYLANVAPEIAETSPVAVIMSEDGSPTAFSLTLNATDADDDALTWRIKTPATNGTASIVQTREAQQVDYVPNGNWFGSDSFVVEVDDGLTGLAEVTVEVTVEPRNDPPVNTVLPLVTGIHHVGRELSADTGTWNDNADLAPGTPLSYAYQWQVADDEGASPTDIVGADSATYTLTGDENLKIARVAVTASDQGEGLPASASATAYSAWTLVDNAAPAIAEGDSVDVTMDEDGAPTAFTLTLDADDADGDALTWRINTQAANGVASVVQSRDSKEIAYAPNANWNGSDSFVVEIDDGLIGLDEITVNVTVEPRNDPPVNAEAPHVVGEHVYGQTLEALTGVWNDAVDAGVGGTSSITVDVRWRRSVDGQGTDATDIDGATDTTYVLGASDVGRYVQAKVTATDDGVGEPSSQSTTLYTPWILVDKARLVVTAGDKSKVYGNANPAFTVSYDGFVNGDDASDLTTQPTADSSADLASGVGTYDIEASGGADENYTFDYIPGTLTVTRAPLTCTAEDKTKVYGDASPPLTIAYAGLKNADTAPGTPPVIACDADQTSPVGAYDITLTGGSDLNYTLTLEDGTLTVTEKMLTVTADDKSKVYGDANPAFTVSYDGFVNGDDASDLGTEPTADSAADMASGVGAYDIEPSGGADENYAFDYGNGTLTISERTLAVTPDPGQEKDVGEQDPTLTYTYSGAINGETPAFTGALSREPGEEAGMYEITVGDLALIDNNAFEAADYAIELEHGVLTIGNAAPTIGQAGPLSATMDEDAQPTAWIAPVLSATDDGYSTLVWRLLTLPQHGVATVSGSGLSPDVLAYTPEANWNGIDSFVVQVDDGYQDGTDEITVNVTVRARNDAPTNTQAPTISGTPHAGQLLTAAQGTWNDDLDQAPGTLSYTYQWQVADDVAASPANIADATASTFTPTVNENLKVVRVVVTAADDGEGLPATQSVSAASAWLYLANVVPEIAETSPVAVTMSEDGSPTAFALTLNATDADDDELTWRIKTQGDNGTASIVQTREAQQVHYAPNENWSGDDSFVVEVDDGLTGLAEVRVDVTVESVNDLPMITGEPDLIVTAGDYYEFTPTVDDVESTQGFEFACTNKPAWGSFDTATGMLSGTPAYDAVGTYENIGISVTDPDGGQKALDPFDIIVANIPVATLRNVPPPRTKRTDCAILVGGASIVSYRWKLDDGAWQGPTAVAEPIIINGVAAGPHRLAVLGTNDLGKEQPADAATVAGWFVDLTAPVAELINPPTPTTNSASLHVGVGGEQVVFYKYKLDAAEWSAARPVEAAITAAGLDNGRHTLSVIGLDAAGNWQAQGAATSVQWTVDTSLPAATLANMPPRVTSVASVSVRVGGEDVVAYRYMIHAPAGSALPAGWSTQQPVSVPIEFEADVDGDYTLYVNGRNALGTWQDGGAGNTIDRATTHVWTLDRVGPDQLADLEAGLGLPPTSVVELQWTPPGGDAVRYEIRYAKAPWNAWESATPVYIEMSPSDPAEVEKEAFRIGRLAANTEYVFAVRVIDAAGNAGAIATVAETTADARPAILDFGISDGLVKEADNSAARDLRVIGKNFVSSEANTVRFVATGRSFDLPTRATSTAATLDVTVPPGVPVGSYNLRVINANGRSTLSIDAYTVLAAPVPLPQVTNLDPPMAAAGDTTDLQIGGAHLTEATKIELVAGGAVAFTHDGAMTATANSIEASLALPGALTPDLYHVRVTTPAGTNEVSAVRLEVYEPIDIGAADGSTVASRGVDMPDDGRVPVGLELTSGDGGTASDSEAVIRATIQPDTQISLTNGQPYMGTVNPPREVPVTDEMADQIENGLGFDAGSAVVFTMGSATERLELGEGQAMFVTIEISLPTVAGAPSIYYLEADGTLTLAGVSGVHKGTAIVPGGTVLESKPDSPEPGYTSTIVGLVIDHMSTYAVSGQSQSITLDLAFGWNLLSLPFGMSADDTPDQVIADAAGTALYAGPLWAWDTSDDEYVDVVHFVAGQGFWALRTKTASAVTDTIYGAPTRGAGLVLAEGWNLVGPTEEMSADDVYADVLIIWTWDSDTQSYRLVDANEDLLPGVAYWIYATAATEIP